MEMSTATVRNILTRASGFLKTVCSHSAQPYRGCSLGRSLCGIYCYVQHNFHLTRGQPWGSFLEARENAARSYLENAGREREWGRRARGEFSIFLSSSTEPFPPQESRNRVTRSLLEAMLRDPPDGLILQTHFPGVAEHLELLLELARRVRLRVHIPIETDLEHVPGLPPHASPVERRFQASAELKAAGLQTVITVSPLLPLRDPEAFFARVAECAGAVVIDHFIQGDGTPDGRRTLRTRLPEAMAALDPASVSIAYRDRCVEIARRHLPGRTGVNIDGFAGRYLPE
jgi:DNA repair photolyase